MIYGCAVDLSLYVGSSAWDICKDFENGKGLIERRKRIEYENDACNKIYALPLAIPSTNEKKIYIILE